ncbi:MAG: YihY/virulence factor BrkB family protein [Eubacteriales bacterium]|nr:YihY/virulence factor BrkB family protein [Eubacteriales bacterium]
MKKFFINCCRILYRFTESEMPIYAANASFFMFIAAFPLMMFVMSILQLVPGLDKDDLLKALMQVLPNMPQIESLVTSIVDSLYVQSASALASLAAFTTLFSASTGTYSIQRGLRKIYGTGRGNYVVNRALALLYTFLFVLVFILTLVLLVLGKLIQSFLAVHLPPVALVTQTIFWLRGPMVACVFLLMFLLIYTIMPGKLQKIRAQLPGALAATAGWVGLSYLFSFYFTNIRHMSYLYGSLTAIILLMMWLYLMFCILFLGAVVNTQIRRVP